MSIYRVVASHDRKAHQTYVEGEALVGAAIEAVCSAAAESMGMVSWFITDAFTNSQVVIHQVQYESAGGRTWIEYVQVEQLTPALTKEDIVAVRRDREDL